MIVFHSSDIDGSLVRLDREESEHCVRVLRHRVGDEIFIIDGRGSLLKCRLIDDDPKGAVAEIKERVPGFGSHPYRLTMAVCPTKNIDRYEWFAEKATEIGVDAIVPVIGDRSERKILKTDRLGRLVMSASKQSLKAAVPIVSEPIPVRNFILAPFACTAGFGSDSDGHGAVTDCSTGQDDCLKLICYCLDDEQKRVSINDALNDYYSERCLPDDLPNIAVLIGPEGDFSPEELELAFSRGWKPVHLGASRLRTETAALVAVTAVYLGTGGM